MAKSETVIPEVIDNKKYISVSDILKKYAIPADEFNTILTSLGQNKEEITQGFIDTLVKINLSLLERDATAMQVAWSWYTAKMKPRIIKYGTQSWVTEGEKRMLERTACYLSNKGKGKVKSIESNGVQQSGTIITKPLLGVTEILRFKDIKKR